MMYNHILCNVVRDNLDDIQHMLKTGHNCSEIARHFGVHPNYLRHELIVLGLWAPQRRRSIYDRHHETIRQMAAQGCSYQQIAEAVGGTVGGVLFYIKENHIAKPLTGRYRIMAMALHDREVTEVGIE